MVFSQFAASSDYPQDIMTKEVSYKKTQKNNTDIYDMGAKNDTALDADDKAGATSWKVS